MRAMHAAATTADGLLAHIHIHTSEHKQTLAAAQNVRLQQVTVRQLLGCNLSHVCCSNSRHWHVHFNIVKHIAWLKMQAVIQASGATGPRLTAGLGPHNRLGSQG